MPTTHPLESPCVLCAAGRGERVGGRLRCAECRWPVGDVPDADLESPRVEVVYYIRYADRIKIGTSAGPRRRLAALRYDELLAFERGGRALERRRHEQFAALRLGGEWFDAAAPLRQHIAALGTPHPWRNYARWVGEAHAALA